MSENICDLAVNKYSFASTQLEDVLDYQVVDTSHGNVFNETASYMNSVEQITDVKFDAKYQTEKVIECRRYKLYKKESDD